MSMLLTRHSMEAEARNKAAKGTVVPATVPEAAAKAVEEPKKQGKKTPKK